MAKAFYTQEEAQQALGVDEDGLKEYVRENKLTEYRDGEQLMYKGSQVESLAGGDAVDLGDSGGPIGLADSGGGSALGLADSGIELGGSSDGINDSGAGSAGELSVEDTGAFAVTDEDDASASYETGNSASGITIFDSDGDADPSAQTGFGAGGSEEQVNLEGIGSGSGLLDLTQEPDDTSFGAETFDDIMPSETGMGTVSGSLAGYSEAGMDIDTAVAPAGTRQVGVVYEVEDEFDKVFGIMAGFATAAVIFVGLAAVAMAAQNGSPGYLSFMMDENGLKLPMVLGVLFGLPIVGAVIGFIVSKMGN